MSLCLTHEELVEVTKKTKYSAQFRALRKMGIDSKPRADGSPLVDRAVYDEWARGGSVRANRKIVEEKTQPRWDA